MTTKVNAQNVGTETFGTTSPVTGAAPTVAADGVPITGDASFTVFVTAPAAQTLSGAGSMLAYLWDPVQLLWARAPDADKAITVSGTQSTSFIAVCTPFRNLSTNLPQRIKYVPSGVTFTGGSGLFVVLEPTTATVEYGRP